MVESSKVKKPHDKFLKDCRNLEKRYPLKILQTSPRQTKNCLQTVGKLVGDAAAIHHIRKNLASRIKPTFEYLEEHDNDIQQALNTFMSKRLELTELLASLTKVLNAATAKLAEQLNAALEFSLFGRRSRPDRRRQLMSLARRRRYKSGVLTRRQQTKRIPRLSRAALCRQLVFGAFLIDNEIEVWLKEVVEKAKKGGKPGCKLDEKSEELLDEISRAREKVRDIYDTADKTGEGIQIFLLSVCHQAFCPEPVWDFLFTGPARKAEIKQFAGMRDMLVAGIENLHPHIVEALDSVKLAFRRPESKAAGKPKAEPRLEVRGDVRKTGTVILDGKPIGEPFCRSRRAFHVVAYVAQSKVNRPDFEGAGNAEIREALRSITTARKKSSHTREKVEGYVKETIQVADVMPIRKVVSRYIEATPELARIWKWDKRTGRHDIDLVPEEIDISQFVYL